MTMAPPPPRPAERLVLSHGCFDLLHLGHIRHLQEARAMGSRLVVSITADKYVDKGPGRPQFSTEQRREALLALKCVDDVVISDSATAENVILQVKPQIYAKGGEYSSCEGDALKRLELEREAVERIGGRLHFTASEKWSSTKLLRSIRLPEKTLEYLDQKRRSGCLPLILEAFEKADQKKIIFTGETILDSYVYVRPLAKPSKEFMLATLYDHTEEWAGGVVAASMHCEWKRKQTITNYSPHAVTKRRFVDADFNRKLFEVYRGKTVRRWPMDHLDSFYAEIKEADIVIAMDFGHGWFEDADRRYLESNSKFFAVTAQSNAGNWGENLITKYIRADYVCVDAQEHRIANERLPMHKARTITMGRRGARSAHKNEVEVPAFADGGIDTMGAGDAFFATAAPLIAVGLDIELATIAGNAAGGLKTTIVGHRSHVSRQDIIKNLEWLLG
jgi:rfaE bifunctional protein nucleotidyltransferase chain/domain